MSAHQHIVASKWSMLFNALTETLLEQATIPKGITSPGSALAATTNQALLAAELSKWNDLEFDHTMPDDDLWVMAASKTFYSGKRPPNAAQIARAMEWLHDYNEVASADWELTGKTHLAYETDVTAYRNPKDLRRIRKAAKSLALGNRWQPGQKLIDFLVPESDRGFDAEALQRIWRQINGELHLGFVTTLHVMTDLGIPVVKTDRKLIRTIVRLGLIKSRPYYSGEKRLSLHINADEALKLGRNEKFSYRVQAVLREASAHSGLPMRSIDYLLVKMGMDPEPGVGLVNTVCDDIPQCDVCHAKPFCAFGRRRKPRKSG